MTALLDPDLVAEDEEQETGPIRRCVVTGERLPRETMLRFVIDPQGVVTIDVAARLPGRGIWLASRRDVLEIAVKKRAFDRAARRGVTVPVDLVSRAEALLVRRCCDDIGLARRAGVAVAGFEKVTSALRAAANGMGALLAASDGSVEGCRKVAVLSPETPLVGILTAAELAQSFGREHVVHGALTKGALAERLLIDAARLAGFRISVA